MTTWMIGMKATRQSPENPCDSRSFMVNCLMPRDDGIPTRASLLERLKDMSDKASWDAFYETYHELIFSVARRAGLTESEAREVVQDTLIAVAKKMPGFTYDPAKDSFKGWLLTVVRWRILDQLSKRSAESVEQHQRCPFGGHAEQDTRTATIDRVPDPAAQLDGVWEEEWEAQVLHAALARIKRQVRPQHYQVYHLHVILGQPVREVARALRVNTAQIYLAKHRVGNLLKKEVKRLKEELY
jgi:RNA polymerase sigma factor (sigma-70 family)